MALSRSSHIITLYCMNMTAPAKTKPGACNSFSHSMPPLLQRVNFPRLSVQINPLVHANAPFCLPAAARRRNWLDLTACRDDVAREHIPDLVQISGSLDLPARQSVLDGDVEDDRRVIVVMDAPAHDFVGLCRPARPVHVN